jgi:phosphoglycerate dehydrogenase-like enzyme
MKLGLLGDFVSAYDRRIRDRLKTLWEIVAVPDDAPPARLAAALAEIDAAIVIAWKPGMPESPKLRLLQVPGAGYETLDLAAVPPKAAVCSAFGHEDCMGEYAVMAMLAWGIRFLETERRFRRGNWKDSSRFGGKTHEEFAGKVVGILGFGRIGQASATRAHALGARIVAVNRTPRPKPGYVERLYAWSDMEAFLAASDFVVVACALSDDTRGLLDAKRLGAMKKTGVIVNLARGHVADEDALFDALKNRRIGGAILDVWYRYPSADDPQAAPSRHPFHRLRNVYMTPHISGWTDGMFDRRFNQIAGNLDRLARGEPLQFVVRPASVVSG